MVFLEFFLEVDLAEDEGFGEVVFLGVDFVGDWGWGEVFLAVALTDAVDLGFK